MAGISGTPVAGPTKTVIVNSAGQLGTATAAKAAPLSAADGRRLLTLIEEQQKQIDALERQVRRR